MTAPTPTRRHRPAEEIARLGREIYDRDIRTQVESGHHGKIVAIDVESGDWAIAGGHTIGDSMIEARKRLKAKRPHAVDVLIERVGYSAVLKFGGGRLRMTE